ncbi:MAG TPA: hypothetical protein VEW04_01370 [Allosphingosinicella sp.]|nr:hypothetical protein [Allosphingosinicella sp.]
MKKLILASLFVATAAAAAPTLETGNGDWSNIPVMRARGSATVDTDVITAMIGLVDSGECSIPGQRPGRISMSVPFLAKFNNQGAAERLVIRPVGCTRADGLLAGEVQRMVESRIFRPEGGEVDGWFRGEIAFSYFRE